jgi:hypothetical protein
MTNTQLSYKVSSIEINIPDEYYDFLSGDWDASHDIRWNKAESIKPHIEPMSMSPKYHLYVHKGLNKISCTPEQYAKITTAMEQLAIHIKERLSHINNNNSQISLSKTFTM